MLTISDTHYLTPLLCPHSVALVGASEREGALGRFVMENMQRAGFAGQLFPVNPKYKSVLGIDAYSSIADLPSVPDLVVIATPGPTVANVLRDAGIKGIRNAVVLSAGFAEIGEDGRAQVTDVTAQLKRYGIRMIGPNCLGIMRPSLGLNATFANAPAKPGALALISQSGAVCTAILDWAATTEIGFSSVISLGGALNLDFGEVLDFLVHDAKTQGILLYVEGVRDARRFLSSLRAASRVKPVVVLKAGRNAAGTHAVTSHTGALAGSDRVFEAVLARAGVVRVTTSLQLFAAARVLDDARNFGGLTGNRLTIVTNGGGPGVVATDCAISNGLAIGELTESTIKSLNASMPPHWSHGNPIDIIGDATPARFSAALNAALDDDNTDAVLALYCPQTVTTAEAAAEAVINAFETRREHLSSGRAKPLFTAWLGGLSIIKARAMFERARVPNFLTPENAVEAFSYLVRFRAHQKMLIQSVSATETMSFKEITEACANAKLLRDAVLAEKRVVLTEDESKSLLDAFGLPVAIGRLATSREEAIAAAQAIGFPVVMKVRAKSITHKSDAGGVRLNLINSRQVGNAFDDMIHDVTAAKPGIAIDGVSIQRMLKFSHSREILVGMSHDPVFGPTIAVGAGGVAVEAIGDIALGLPPLNLELADAMLAGTRINRLLGAYRNVPGIDRDALLQLLVRVSTIACVLPWVREIDLNPVLAHPGGVAVVDARIVIDPDAPASDPRYRHMAIFPYPVELERTLALKSGEKFYLRAIRPDDAARERAFVEALSDTSRYMRFLHPVSALSDAMIARFTQLDYSREMALIALAPDESAILGVTRYFPNPDGKSVEYAIAVLDDWQGKGLGRILMENLLACARAAGYEVMEGSVLKANTGMLHLITSLGFELHPDELERDVVRVTRSLVTP